MRIAICDDSKREQEQFINALRGWDNTQRPECFFDGASLLNAAEKMPPFDLVFLDIYMPGENGVEVAKTLRGISPETGIVFVTTSKEHAVEAFSLDALHYLVKPVTTDDVVETFRRFKQLQSRQRQELTLTAGSVSYHVYLDEICYLQVFNHILEVTLNDGRCLKVWMTLSELLEKLGENFLKISRNTVVIWIISSRWVRIPALCAMELSCSYHVEDILLSTVLLMIISFLGCLCVKTMTRRWNLELFSS